VGEEPARGIHATAAWPFLLAGLLQPGIGQIFATLGIREAGASRASMVFGTAPLVAVTLAFVFLGEPVTAPVVLGVLLIVGGSVDLAWERDRPAHLRRIGLVYAFVTVVLFAVRDNLVRHLSVGTSAPPAVSACAALLGGLVLLTAVVRPRLSRRALPFVPAGLCFGLSYVALFEAFYRGRVTVVSPLVATESLFGVGLSALLLGRRELVRPRLVAGAVLIVAGGVIIGAFR
jgi:drug/metabolite transporter (DMT)-like permease